LKACIKSGTKRKEEKKMKKVLMVFSLFLAIGLVMAPELKAASITLCDSYGKTWSLSTTGTEGDTLVGTRDTKNLLGCGGLYVRGMFDQAGGLHFIVTSLEGTTDGCVAAIWDGRKSGSTISGTWYNQNGTGTGSFTLTSGACSAAAEAEAISEDPSLEKVLF
jgi:hypothetical protein